MKTVLKTCLVVVLMIGVGVAFVGAVAPQVLFLGSNADDRVSMATAPVSESQISSMLSAMDDAAFKKAGAERQLASSQGRLADYYREALEIADAIDTAKINAVVVFGELMTRAEARDLLAKRVAILEKYEAHVARQEKIVDEYAAQLDEMTANLQALVERSRQLATDSTAVAAAKTRLLAPENSATTVAVDLAKARAAFRTTTLASVAVVR